MHAWQNSNAHLNSSFTELQDSHPRMAVSCYSIQAVMGRSKLLSKGRMPLRPKLRQLQLRGNHPATVQEGLLRATAWCTIGALQSLLQYRTGSSVALRVYSAYLSSTDGTVIHSVCKKVWPFHFHVQHSTVFTPWYPGRMILHWHTVNYSWSKKWPPTEAMHVTPPPRWG